MSAWSFFIFLFTSRTVCAFIPPFNDYQDKLHEIKGAKQQNGQLEGMGNKIFLPRILNEGLSELQGNTENNKGIRLDTADFKFLREKNAHLVDKTNFITDFMNDEHDHVMITRPRGFGKSFSHSMLYHFLNIRGNSTDLFKGTYIAKNRDFCRAHQNRHPVIRVSFGELRNAKTWEEAVFLFKVAFSKMLEDHPNLMDKKPNSAQAPRPKSMGTPASLMTIQALSKHLYDQFKKKAVVLIDEYDAPVFAAYYEGYDSKMMGFLHSLYQSALNENPFLHKSLILGVSRAGKEKIFPQKDLLKIYTVMESRYSSYFGFNKAETAQLLRDYKLDGGLIETMMQKYGGYRFGDHLLLNPYSVTRTLVNDGSLMNYWMDSDRCFVKLMRSGGVVSLFESEVLLMKLPINRTYDVSVGYFAVKNDLDPFWTVVTDSGYVTFAAEKKQEVVGRFNYTLFIPNEEVSAGFGRFVDEFHAEHENVLPYKEWIKMLVSLDSSGSIECLRTYFDGALQYFAAKNVSDPIAQIELLFRTLFEGPRQYYETVEFDRKTNTLSAELKGGRKGIPLKIMVVYSDLETEGNLLIPITKLLVQYRRLFTHIKFGSTEINGKDLLYIMENTRGNLLNQLLNCIDRWIGRPVENLDTKLRTCLKRWWYSDLM